MYKFDDQRLKELAALPDAFQQLIGEFQQAKKNGGASQADLLAGLEVIGDLLNNEIASDLYECIMGYAYPDLTEN